MPAAPFAAREARLNAAVVKHVANALALLDGVEVAGIFDDDFVVGGVGAIGVATSQPAFSLLTSLVPADVEGLPLEVRGKAYTVAEDRPDGSGWTVLLLEVA